MTAHVPTLTSREVYELLGITRRMLDHVARARLYMTPGSGVGREWDAETVARLRVAKALLDAAGWTHSYSTSPWTAIVSSVMDGPVPDPGLPWVTLAPDGTVTYWHGISVHPGLSAKWLEQAP